MARVAIDAIPTLGQPEAVFTALGEAVELRDRLRQANEELAAAQASTSGSRTRTSLTPLNVRGRARH
jgi:hypothetical protein